MKDICKPIAVGSLRTIFVYFLRRLFTFLLSLKNGPIISAKGCSSIPCFPIVVDIHLGCSDLRSSQDASIYFCPYSSFSLSLRGGKELLPREKVRILCLHSGWQKVQGFPISSWRWHSLKIKIELNFLPNSYIFVQRASPFKTLR